MKQRGFLAIVWASAVALFSAAAHGQANLQIKINALSNGVSEVSWPVRSLVPAPGAQIFPAFQFTVSSNLVDWVSEGERIGGPDLANQTARVSVTNDTSHLFVKVESILD